MGICSKHNLERDKWRKCAECRKEYHKKYHQSGRYKIARLKYNASPKGKTQTHRDNTSPAGKERRRKYQSSNKGKSTRAKGENMGRIYNPLTGDNKKFMLMKGFFPGEFTVRAKGVRKAIGTDELSLKAGDGRYGVPMRHTKRDLAKMTKTVDGTGFKSARKSIARPRKNVCLLASTAEIYRASIDPLVKQSRGLASRKAKRARNRNRKARYHNVSTN